MGIRKEYKKYFGRQIKDECVHNAEDVIEFAKHYQALSQHDVVVQGEQLKAFAEWRNKKDDSIPWITTMEIEEYLKSL